MIAYARRPFQQHIHYQFERLLLKQSEVRVAVGDDVSPETIIATGWERAGFRTFNLSELFKVDIHSVEDTLVKTIGTRIYKGEVIAKRKELFGLREKVFKSPINGVFVDYEPLTSRITIQYLPLEVRLIAGVFGKISQIIPSESIKIAAHINAIHSVASFGVHREGGLLEVGYRDIPIQSDQLRDEFENKIIFGGSGITTEALYKALSIGVQAVVTGGVDYEEFLHLTGSKGRYEDVGISLLALDGFGSTEIPSRIYEILKQSEHEHVFYEPKDSVLILPGSKALNQDMKDALPWTQYEVVREGQTVRMLGNEYYSYRGIVKSVNEESRIIGVEFPGEKQVETDVDNVEILLEQ